MALSTVAIRAGVGFAVGTALGRIVRPVTQTIGSVGKAIAQGNERVRERAETRQLVRQTNDTIVRMDLETQQKTALIEYGTAKVELDAKHEALSDGAKAAIAEWQEQFPEIL